VNYIKGIFIIGLALGMSTAAFATRLQQDNDDYGSQGPDCTLAASSGFACDLTNASGLFGEQFPYTFNNTFDVNFHVWDFELTSDISNFTLTLTGSIPFATDQTLTSPDLTEDFFGYGLFLCGVDETNDPSSGNRICTTSDVSTAGVSASLINSSEVQFTVSGDGKGLVFYVAESLPVVEDPTVTAAITPNGVATPEPGTVPLLLAGGLALVLFGRRRLARLQ